MATAAVAASNASRRQAPGAAGTSRRQPPSPSAAGWRIRQCPAAWLLDRLAPVTSTAHRDDRDARRFSRCGSLFIPARHCPRPAPTGNGRHAVLAHGRRPPTRPGEPAVVLGRRVRRRGLRRQLRPASASDCGALPTRVQRGRRLVVNAPGGQEGDQQAGPAGEFGQPAAVRQHWPWHVGLKPRARMRGRLDGQRLVSAAFLRRARPSGRRRWRPKQSLRRTAPAGCQPHVIIVRSAFMVGSSWLKKGEGCVVRRRLRVHASERVVATGLVADRQRRSCTAGVWGNGLGRGETTLERIAPTCSPSRLGVPIRW